LGLKGEPLKGRLSRKLGIKGGEGHQGEKRSYPQKDAEEP